MHPTNPFETLGLPNTATHSELVERWRKLRSEHHPDHGGDGQEFHTLRMAYNAALNLIKRNGNPLQDGKLVLRTCPICKGAGKVESSRFGFYTYYDVCSTCHGRKKVDHYV